MAVESVKERFERRRSSQKGKTQSHTRVWLVTCNDIADGTAVAMHAPGIPTSDYSYRGCPVSSIEAEPVQNSDVHFDVTVEFESDDQTFGLPANPLDRDAEVSWDYAEATNAYFLDCHDPPRRVVNSAGDPFASDLTREEGEPVITIVVNEAGHNASGSDEFSHTVNIDAVRIDSTTFAPGTLKLSPIKAQKVKERVQSNDVYEDFTYYRRTYVVKARKDGWLDKPLDVGLNEMVGDLDDGFDRRPILDVTQQPVRTPWPLDGNGAAAPIGTPDEPVTLEFQPYKKMSWVSLKPFSPNYWGGSSGSPGGGEA